MQEDVKRKGKKMVSSKHKQFSCLEQYSSQRGSVLLEALIAIVIFSMGLLAIVGLQAASIKSVSDSQYRLEASFLANRVVAEMWTNAANINAYALPGGGAAGLDGWLAEVQSRMPGSTAANAPTIAIAANPSGGFTATVVIRWQASGESTPHNYTTVAYINPNP
jgi:type IV pilus assembly protein PilV